MSSGSYVFNPALEDIHMVVESALIAKTGDVGKKLHTGRSRNDQVALDMRMWMRDRIDEIVADIRRFQSTMVTLAEKQGSNIMPGYTHLQRAQPVMLGSYLLAWVEMAKRDVERILDARKRVNLCPLGAGALAGSTLPLDREFVAEKLGFDGLCENSIDAVSDRDFCAEFIACCAISAVHLSRWAEDWIIFASEEYGFVRIADAFCTSSSMMPQKRNPDVLELIRGKTGGVIGRLVAMLTILKGQPLSYNRDMQEDKESVFSSADTIQACLRVASAVAENSTFCKVRISERLDAGFPDATALAEYLVVKGVPFRAAHQVVGQLVAECENKKLQRLSDVKLSDMQNVSLEIGPDVYEYLGPENVVKRYATEGAAGSRQLKRQLEKWRKNLRSIT
jgi:argininosuccinate lyase